LQAMSTPIWVRASSGVLTDEPGVWWVLITNLPTAMS